MKAEGRGKRRMVQGKQRQKLSEIPSWGIFVLVIIHNYDEQHGEMKRRGGLDEKKKKINKNSM